MTIEEQLSAAVATASALVGERDDLRATIEKLTVGTASELESAKADIVAKDARIAELTEAFDKANISVSEMTKQILSLESSKVSASKEAAVLAASVGITPTALPMEGEATKEAVSHLAVFMSLPVGKDRTDYFNAHKAAIIKAAI